MCVVSYARLTFFCSCDLNLDPMTLIYDRDLELRQHTLPSTVQRDHNTSYSFCDFGAIQICTRHYRPRH